MNPIAFTIFGQDIHYYGRVCAWEEWQGGRLGEGLCLS